MMCNRDYKKKTYLLHCMKWDLKNKAFDKNLRQKDAESYIKENERGEFFISPLFNNLKVIIFNYLIH